MSADEIPTEVDSRLFDHYKLAAHQLSG